ncbi:MAG TPA: HAD-IA family hydrolase [Roseiarcus sp.]|jgi:HAD superfamily hydrolase (TIGR01509 family)
MKTALLFDLDGTLVDSDPEHLVAFQRVFAPHGIELDHAEYAAKIMGASNDMIASRYLAHLSLPEQAAILDAKEADYRDNLGALEPILGALALLDFADRRGLKRAVVTNAPRANAEKVLSALGIGPRLPIVVIGSELARSKPDPLPYLMALERTGASASDSIAFEDSLSGVRSAAAAGLAVVGMTTTLGSKTLIEAGATFAARNFTDSRIFELIEARLSSGAEEGA